MSFSAGDLRHKVMIQERVNNGKDAKGRRQYAYTPWVTTMASLWDVSGREFYEAAAKQLENTVTFVIRWRDGLRNDMRLVFGGATYEILQINRLGYKRDFIQIKARLVQAEEGGAIYG